LIAVCALGSLCGCQAAKRTVDAGEANTRKFIQRVEPTGIIAETGARKETWEAFRYKADQIDVETFNEAVDNLAIVARKLANRLDACSSDDIRKITAELSTTLVAIRQQVEQAQLTQASAAITKTAETLEKQISLFNVPELNSVLVESKLAVRNIQATGTQVQEHTTTTAKDVRTLANEVARILQQLPMEELTESIHGVKSAATQLAAVSKAWPASAAKVEDTLAAVRLGSRIGIGILGLLGCCTIVWLIKNLRSPQSQ